MPKSGFFAKKLGTCLTSVQFAPGDFAEKRVLKIVERLSGHCRANQVLKLTTKPFTGRTLRGLLIQGKHLFPYLKLPSSFSLTLT